MTRFLITTCLACLLSTLAFAGPKGGKRGDSDEQPGGAGATHVPIVDEDWRFMVSLTRAHVGADAANELVRGTGMLVAVLDGGFNLNHPDLLGRCSPLAYDALDDDFDVEDFPNGLDEDRDGLADDGIGHGTFVAGMILQVAPEAMILPIRIRDDEGWGTDAAIKAGLHYASTVGAHVVNVSVIPENARPSGILRMAKSLVADGIPVVCAAGNDGKNGTHRLAWSKRMIAVAAVDLADRVAPWSNHALDGDALDSSRPMIAATGVDVYGPLGCPEDASSGYWSGTSFATGLVSGAVALIRQAHPRIDAYEVQNLIYQTLAPVTDEHGAPLPFMGRLDLYRAVTE